MGLVLRYIQELKGHSTTYRYRRRVSAKLRPFVGKSELVATLGNSRSEALRRYPTVHAAFEKELEAAKRAYARQTRLGDSTASTKLQRYEELMDEIRALGIENPAAEPLTEDEKLLRELMAEHIASRYPEDPETGEPRIDNPSDVFKVRTLMGDVPPKPGPTLEDAMRVYVAEKLDGTEFEFRKKLRRVERIVANVHAALDPVPPLDQWTRDTAKKVRDHYLSLGLKPASVRRELNTLKGLITCFITEKEAGFENPFRKLDLPRNVEAVSEARYPLPDEVKDQITALIIGKAKKDVQLLWRLLDGTGARIAEITGLRVQDVTVDGELPHIKIRAHSDRRLKTASSARDIPLVGDALQAAVEALALAGDSRYLFARYIKPTGPTTASAVLMKRIREITDDPKHTVHSLRHGMADRLSLAEASAIDKNAIMGHLNPGTGERHYGGTYAKLKVLTRVMKKAFGVANS